jgi:hypothetical protein
LPSTPVNAEPAFCVPDRTLVPGAFARTLLVPAVGFASALVTAPDQPATGAVAIVPLTALTLATEPVALPYESAAAPTAGLVLLNTDAVPTVTDAGSPALTAPALLARPAVVAFALRSGNPLAVVPTLAAGLPPSVSEAVPVAALLPDAGRLSAKAVGSADSGKTALPAETSTPATGPEEGFGTAAFVVTVVPLPETVIRPVLGKADVKLPPNARPLLPQTSKNEAAPPRIKLLCLRTDSIGSSCSSPVAAIDIPDTRRI